MSDLPAENPYAKFKPAQASDNPYAKFAPATSSGAAAPAPAAQPSLIESMWNTVKGVGGAPARFGQGVAEGAVGMGIPEGPASQLEGGPARFAGRAIGTGGKSLIESMWDTVKAPGQMVTGEMQPGPQAEQAARGMALGIAGAGGGFRPGMGTSMMRPAVTSAPGIPPVGGGTRLATVQMPTGAARIVKSPPLTPEQMPPAAAPAAETSALGDAIATNNPGAVDSYITKRYRSVVKPPPGTAKGETGLAQQDQRILTTVDQIIANKGALKLTDAPPGQLPRSLRQFSEAVDQTKKSLFQKYDAMAQQSGDVGVQVDLAPVISELRSIGTRPEVVDLHPELIPQAEQLARNFEARGFYSPSAAQDAIENLNRTLSAFYKNPTEQTVGRANLLAPVARILRSQLDAAIGEAQGPGYQALRLQYGALASVEKDVARAVQREANKIPGGLAGTFADMAASEEAIRGVLTLNPAALARAGGIRAAKSAIKYIYDPNRAIERMFARRAAPQVPPAPLAAPVAQAGGIGAGAGIASGGFPQPKRDPDQPLQRSIGQF
jgi:hypothetical protein